MSNDKKSVYQKLLNIQSKLKAPKSQTNKFGGYKYRNTEDILEALKPLLSEEKAFVLLTDKVECIEGRYYIRALAKFVDIENGDTIETSAYAREEESKKGMDASQLTGSTSSYARKYRLNGLFAIDDTRDADTLNTHGKEQVKPKENTVLPKAPIDDYIINQAQLKRLYTIASKNGVNSETVKEQVQKRFGKDPAKLTKAEYDRVCTGYENLK